MHKTTVYAIKVVLVLAMVLSIVLPFTVFAGTDNSNNIQVADAVVDTSNWTVAEGNMPGALNIKSDSFKVEEQYWTVDGITPRTPFEAGKEYSYYLELYAIGDKVFDTNLDKAYLNEWFGDLGLDHMKMSICTYQTNYDTIVITGEVTPFAKVSNAMNGPALAKQPAKVATKDKAVLSTAVAEEVAVEEEKDYKLDNGDAQEEYVLATAVEEDVQKDKGVVITPVENNELPEAQAKEAKAETKEIKATPVVAQNRVNVETPKAIVSTPKAAETKNSNHAGKCFIAAAACAAALIVFAVYDVKKLHKEN